MKRPGQLCGAMLASRWTLWKRTWVIHSGYSYRMSAFQMEMENFSGTSGCLVYPTSKPGCSGALRCSPLHLRGLGDITAMIFVRFRLQGSLFFLSFSLNYKNISSDNIKEFFLKKSKNNLTLSLWHNWFSFGVLYKQVKLTLLTHSEHVLVCSCPFHCTNCYILFLKHCTF